MLASFLLLSLSNISMVAQKYTGLTATTSDGQNPTGIFDGNTTGTMWQDQNNIDDGWIVVDLGSVKQISTVKIYWENANAKAYNLSFSNDGNSYSNQKDYSNMAPGNRVDVISDINLSARYIKMQGVERQMEYGYAIYEFEVYPQLIPELTSVKISASKSEIKATESLQLTLTGYDQLGDVIVISDPINWSAESGSSISSTGLFSSAKFGIYTVTATVKGFTDSFTIDVKPNSENLALDKTYSASSSAYPVDEAFDGNKGSRWSSENSDPQWIMVDLGREYDIDEIIIYWETANAKTYIIEGSSNQQDWTTISQQNNMAEGERTDRIENIEKGARYVRLTGTEANTGYGYSIWEFEIYGKKSSTGGEIPMSPTNFASNPSVYATFLTWNAPQNAHAVEYYKIFKNGVFEALMDKNSTSMTLSGLMPNTTYTFTIIAYNEDDEESAPATIQTTTQEREETGGGSQYGIGNIALSMPTEHSALAGAGGNVSSNAVDGNLGSRWESAADADAWMSIDLGLSYFIDYVILRWEQASGRRYLIQVSSDNVNWQTVYEFNPSTAPELAPRVDELRFEAVEGRFIKMQGVERNSPWGYSLYEFEVYSPGSGPDDIPDPNPNPNPAPVPPGPAEFSLTSPIDATHISDTRKPVLKWNAFSGANGYEVWVNITRDDYDWHEMGSLLDRFTKVGETTNTEFTLQDDLVDRWTYKWYVVAKTNSGNKYSDLGIFSLYIANITPINDGINIIDGCRDLNKNGVIDPYENWRLPIEERVQDLMSKMTIEEKVMQMFYNAQKFPTAGWAFGPGTVDDMFQKQKDATQTRLGIPFVSAGDNIHGYKTTYPVQTAFAAGRDMQLAYESANMQRVEQIAVGAKGVLGPLAEVGTKVLYPRTQEGCGEDADMAAAMVRAMICGFQGGPELNPTSVMVTTKHWPGQGAGGEAIVVYDAVTAKYHLKPWFAHMDAGGATVMPGYAGSTYLDPGGPGAGDSKKIIDYLRDVVGFQGPVCTDWLPYGAWVDCANAGSDIMGGADPGAAGFNMQDFINGVPEWRINEAVERILTVKFKLGVFEDPYGDPINGHNTWATPEHKDIALQSARKAMTLISNNGILPLDNLQGANVLVTGSRAHDGDGYRIWTSYFNRELGAKTIYEAIKDRGDQNGYNVYLDNAPNPDIAVVVIGEPTYTHGTTWEVEKPWVHDAYFPIQQKYEYDKTTLNDVKALGIPMIVVITMPRPYIIDDVVEMADAVVIAYRSGDETGPALTDVLTGVYPPTGRLPWQLPRSMEQIGTDKVNDQVEKWDLPFDIGATAAERQEIRSKIAQNEKVNSIYGDPLYQYGFGLQNYELSDDSNLPTKIDVKKEDESKDKLVVYPNPFNNKLNIITDENVLNVAVYSLSGVIIKAVSNVSDDNSVEIDTSDLSNGIYLIKVKTQDGEISKVVVKN